MSDINRKPLMDATEPETLCMRRHSLQGNRETRETPSSKDGGSRFGKVLGQTSDMHVSRESDDSIVPEKRANNAGPKAAAELVEGRGSTKGNATQTLLVPDAAPGRRDMDLWGIREATTDRHTQGKSRMKYSFTYGSVRGTPGNRRSYRDSL